MELASLIISICGTLISIVSLIITCILSSKVEKIALSQKVDNNSGVAINGQMKGKIYGKQ